MADAPEETLNKALAQLLHTAGLAKYVTGSGVYPEQAVVLDGKLPTTINECTLITPLAPVVDGRADMTYRTQFYTRRTGSILVARRWAAALRTLLDQKEYTPTVLGISWAWEFSSLDFEPDTQGRSAVAATYYFRGRRQ